METLISELEAKLAEMQKASPNLTPIISDLDVSQNHVTPEQLETLLSTVSTSGITVKRFRMFGIPTFNDEAMRILADHLRSLSSKEAAPTEMHLSDCAITSEGFYHLMSAIEETDLFPLPPIRGKATPLYLRLENNYIAESSIQEKIDAGVLRAFQKRHGSRGMDESSRREGGPHSPGQRLLEAEDGRPPGTRGRPPAEARERQVRRAGQAGVAGRRVAGRRAAGRRLAGRRGRARVAAVGRPAAPVGRAAGVARARGGAAREAGVAAAAGREAGVAAAAAGLEAAGAGHAARAAARRSGLRPAQAGRPAAGSWARGGLRCARRGHPSRRGRRGAARRRKGVAAASRRGPGGCQRRRQVANPGGPHGGGGARGAEAAPEAASEWPAAPVGGALQRRVQHTVLLEHGDGRVGVGEAHL
ncbi:unnamed protein product, partial [Prorocentrum cordatum]